MSYRLYASGQSGYVLLLIDDDISNIYKVVDRELKRKDFYKYLLIENINKSDQAIGLFFDEDGYNEFKQEQIKIKKK